MHVLITFMDILSWATIGFTIILEIALRNNPFYSTKWNKAAVSIIWLVARYFNQ